MRRSNLLARIEVLEKEVADLRAQLGAQRVWPYVEPWPAETPVMPHRPAPQIASDPETMIMVNIL